jgi:hypothetical protein
VNKFIRVSIAFAAGLFLMTGAQASSFQLDFNYDFSNPGDLDSAPPSGSDWLIAVFDDGGSAGSATLTLTVGNIGVADVTSVYLNFDDAQGISNLSIAQSGGTGPTATAINQSMNTYQADGDGIYDLKIDWANNDFMAGEVITFDITGSGAASGFVANDFNYLAEIGDPKGPFFGAAKFQSTGVAGEQSAWVAAVPVPAAVWLFGSALGFLGWIRRRRVTS